LSAASIRTSQLSEVQMQLHCFDRRHLQLLLEMQSNERDSLNIGLYMLDRNLTGTLTCQTHWRLRSHGHISTGLSRVPFCSHFHAPALLVPVLFCSQRDADAAGQTLPAARLAQEE